MENRMPAEASQHVPTPARVETCQQDGLKNVALAHWMA